MRVKVSWTAARGCGGGGNGLMHVQQSFTKKASAVQSASLPEFPCHEFSLILLTSSCEKPLIKQLEESCRSETSQTRSNLKFNRTEDGILKLCAKLVVTPGALWVVFRSFSNRCSITFLREFFARLKILKLQLERLLGNSRWWRILHAKKGRDDDENVARNIDVTSNGERACDNEVDEAAIFPH